jgi:hypothetical protein
MSPPLGGGHAQLLHNRIAYNRDAKIRDFHSNR